MTGGGNTGRGDEAAPGADREVFDRAESDYCRAIDLLHAKQVGEGLDLLRRLLDLPGDVGAVYRPRMVDDLHHLLADLLVARLAAPGSTPAAEYLGVLQVVAGLARDLGSKDVLLQVELRYVTVSRALGSEVAEHMALARFLSIVPWSQIVGARFFLLSKRAGNVQALEETCLRLAQLCLQTGSFRKARALAAEAMAFPGQRDAASQLLHATATLQQKVERGRAHFESVSGLLDGKLGAENRVAVYRKYLAEFAWDGEAWATLADQLLALGEPREASDALFAAGRIAFTGTDLPRARAIFGRILRLEPGNISALTFLIEVLCALGSLPAGFADIVHLRLAILCQEGVDAAAAVALRKCLSGTVDDIPFLEALDGLARCGGCGAVVAEIGLNLGRHAATGGLKEEARSYFAEALAWGSDPNGVLARIEALPPQERVFNPMELLHLRNTLVNTPTREEREAHIVRILS